MPIKEMIVKAVSGFLYFEGKNEVCPQLSEKSILFSNKKVDQVTNLSLSYGQKELIGKRVYVDETGVNTIRMVLVAVLPGEPLTFIEPITVSPTPSGYSFKGSGIGANKTTFDYTGKMEAGKLSLQLTNVKLEENELTKNNTWNFIPASQIKKTKVFNDPPKDKEDYYYMSHKSHLMNVRTVEQGSLLEMMFYFIDTYFAQILRPFKSITFHPDGSISAKLYVPKGVSVRDYKRMMGIEEKMFPECQLREISLANLATYYVKNDMLTITPNIEMLLSILNKTVTPKEVVGDSQQHEYIQMIYAQLLKWCTEGIQLLIKDPSLMPKEYLHKKLINEGDILVQVTKDEIAPLFGASYIIRHRFADRVGMSLYDWYVSKGKSLDEENFIRKVLENFKFQDIFKELDLMPDATYELGVYLCKDKPMGVS